MFSEKLENLIKATLEDGIIEEHEKTALIKRAQAEGVDIDELNIYINSLLQKRKRELRKEENAIQTESYKKKKEAFGKTCPNCGKQVKPLMLKCDCGYEFVNQGTGQSAKTLSDKIEEIRKDRNIFNCDKVERIREVISYTPVPASKEDIVDLLALAAPNSKIKGGLWGTMRGRVILSFIFSIVSTLIWVALSLLIAEHTSGDDELGLVGFCAFLGLVSVIAIFALCLMQSKDILEENKTAEVWRAKFDQVIIKAHSLRGDPEFSAQINYYENIVKKDDIKRSRKIKAAIISSIIVLCGMVAALSMIYFNPTNNANRCGALIEKSINRNNTDKALSYARNYIRRNSYWRIKDECKHLASALYEDGRYQDAIEMDPDNESGLKQKIVNIYISEGLYDDAESCIKGMYIGHYYDAYYQFICQCIDDMKAKGNRSKINTFIENHISYFSETASDAKWKRDQVKKRLYSYAGNKYSTSNVTPTDKSDSGNVQSNKDIMNFTGNISNYPIHLSLRINGSKVTGRYYYDSQRKNGNNASLQLSGTKDGNVLSLKEFSEGQVTGHMDGTLTGNYFMGTYTLQSNQKKDLFTFQITYLNQGFFDESELTF